METDALPRQNPGNAVVHKGAELPAQVPRSPAFLDWVSCPAAGGGIPSGRTLAYHNLEVLLVTIYQLVTPTAADPTSALLRRGRCHRPRARVPERCS
jgi:hypothetical protein